MHDIKLIRDDPSAFDNGLKRRGLPPESADVLKRDAELRALLVRLQTAQARRNEASKLIGQAKAKKDEAQAQALMAEVAGLSRAHLIRAFRREFFITPHAFQTDMRVRHARRLLRDGATPSDTALECGFADQAHMTRHFKARSGVTPAAFRKG